MKVDLKTASKVLDKTQDEVMFLVQTNKLEAEVNEDLFWEFELEDLIALKEGDN